MTDAALTDAALTDAARTCIATVGSLPETGTSVSAWWIVVAAALILAGTVVLLRARSRGRAVVPMLAIGLLVASMTLPSPPPAAASSGAEVRYSDGCTLFEVDADSVTWTPPPHATGLLPGDNAPVLSLTVTNNYARPIRLTGRLQVVPALASSFNGRVRFDGSRGPVRLPPGEQIGVTLDIGLARGAGDDIQDAESPLELVLTASAR